MTTWTLVKTARFEASHQLPHHDGKCQRLHGHSWQIDIEVGGEAIHEGGPKQGMVVDYGDLGAPLNAMVEARLDHWHLNDSTGLENPTSEELARYCYDMLRPTLGPQLRAVTIHETCTARCTYRP